MRGNSLWSSREEDFALFQSGFSQFSGSKLAMLGKKIIEVTQEGVHFGSFRCAEAEESFEGELSDGNGSGYDVLKLRKGNQI